MERQLKKRRLNGNNPDTDLHIQRARNDLHLKSRFEAIFEKYGKDFSEVGDEIDLETGRIVVDKGHIQKMAHEQDTGQDINLSSQQRSEYRSAVPPDRRSEGYIAPENNSTYEPRYSQSLDSSAEELTDSAARSDDEMIDIISKRASAIGSQIKAANNSPRSCLNTDQQSGCPAQQNTQSFLHNKTPLRRLEVDNISNRLSTVRKNIDCPPIEPAWQAPPLPIDRLTQFQPRNIVPVWLEQREQRRSLSPPTGSLWAPLPGSGRRKTDGKPGSVRKSKASTGRASMPAFKINKLVETPSKKQPSSTNIKQSPVKHNATGQACAKVWSLEEKDLLRQLRASTDLTYAQMTSYFPGRSWIEIECNWLLIAGSAKAPMSTSVKPYTGSQVHIKADKNFVRIDPGSVVQEDEEIDELQLYEFGFQTNKPILPHQGTETQSPTRQSLPIKSPNSTPPNRNPQQQDSKRNDHEHRVGVVEIDQKPLQAPPLIYKVSPQVQIQSRLKSPKTSSTSRDLASAASATTSATPRTEKKASRLRKSPQTSKAFVLATPAPARSEKKSGPSRKAAACPKSFASAGVGHTPVTSQTVKTPSLSGRRSSVKVPILPVDDSSEDELATPKQIPEKLSVAKVSVARASPGFSKTQAFMASKTPNTTAKASTPIVYQIDDVSDDELSTPFKHGALVLRIPTKVPVSTRRKTSIW